MTTPATKDLYKQLRTATLTKDEAAAVRILKRILEADPGDKDAAKQLAALTAGGKGSAASGEKKKKKKEVSATKMLYQRYRSACMAHNDAEAFDLLEEILKLEPEDSEAIAQKTAVGKRLASSYAPELAEAVASGEVEKITRMLEKLQRYASDEYLQMLPDYASAKAIYRAEQTRVAKEKLKALIDEFSQLQEPFARHEKASSIQDFAEKNGLVLEPETQAGIAGAHEAWEQLCRESEQYEEFNTLADEYKQLQQKVSLREELQNCRVELELLRERTRQLTEVSEADYLVEQIDKTMRKVMRAQQEQKKKKLVLRGFTWGGLALLAAAGGLCVYAHTSVETRCQELAQVLSNKNIQGTRVLVDKAYPMAYIYKKMDAGYTELLNRASAWLKAYDVHADKVAAYEKWLDEHLGKSSLSQSETLLENIGRGETLLSELANVFGLTPSAELIRKHKQFCSEVISLKQKAFDKYRNPPGDVGLEVLANQYKEYVGLRHLMEFSGEENTVIQQAFRQRAERVLFQNVEDARELNKAIEQCKKYMSSLELPSEILDRLIALRNELQEYQNLDQQLKQCSTLDEYIRTLRKCEKYLGAVSGSCTPDMLASFAHRLPDILFRMRADALSRKYARMSDSELRSKLERIRQVYSGKASLFSDFNKTKYSGIVDKMTLPESGAHWSDKFRQIICGDKVYIGKISKVNDIPYVREVTPNGKLSDEALKINGVYKNIPLVMKTLRANVGISRMDLQRCVLLPTNLMSSLAKANDKTYSPLARAYLFGLCVQMLDCVDEEDSGVLLSAQLRKDIAAFNELSRWLSRHKIPLAENCWTKRHSLEAERKINRFFESVANKDYAADIMESVDRLRSKECELVGYVNKEGNYVPLKTKKSDKMYQFSNGKLVEHMDGKGAPYAPVFVID